MAGYASTFLLAISIQGVWSFSTPTTLLYCLCTLHRDVFSDFFLICEEKEQEAQRSEQFIIKKVWDLWQVDDCQIQVKWILHYSGSGWITKIK